MPAEPCEIRVIPHVWIPMSDGTRLAARVWLPVDAERHPVPAILEYIPYRKNDATSLRDAGIHPYVAARGYACVRVDLRGSGDSDGILLDEYLPQEQEDGIEVLRWLAARPWCDGATGIIGKSWGGFNGLQIAAHAPPELKAVISVMSTDDRYEDDVHYYGGGLLAQWMPSWAATMLAYNARPPDPAVVGDAWRETWFQRMEGSPPYLEEWLAHQRRDAYWRQGSVCEDYAAIRCPVYMVGGWGDAYTSALLRFCERFPGTWKALVGPWAHVYPQDGTPAPAIGFLQEAVRWWDRWLKGEDNGIDHEPRVRTWLQDGVPPRPAYSQRPGRWVADATWPSPAVTTTRLMLSPGRLAAPPEAPERAALRHTGRLVPAAHPGNWCAFGMSADYAEDQRGEDGQSLCFDGAPLEAPLAILGRPLVAVEVSADRSQALLAARLCDVAPDGSSTLISRGVLNLTHRDGHARPTPLVPGQRYPVELALKACGYVVPAGHRVRLALSSAYWPMMWPSPEPVTLTVDTGPDGALYLPVRGATQDPPPPAHFDDPQSAPAPPHELLGPPPDQRRVATYDIATGAHTVTDDMVAFPPVRLEGGLEYTESWSDVLRVVDGDPLSASIRCERTADIGRGDWRVRVETVTTLTCTATTFEVVNAVTGFEADRPVFAKSWHRAIERDGI